MLRSETRRILSDIVRENQARGVPDNALKEHEKEIVGTASQSARDRLKGTFILIRIADQEKISVTKEEFDLRIAQLAVRYGMARDKMVAELDKRNALDQISEDILTAKVLDFLSVTASVQTKSE
jgi:FKBP-type peptidyl-prolyl cis-trans isomerase (trigger factor)